MPDEVLAKGLIACPDCTTQREARLKMELKFNAMKLALARSIRGVLPDGPEAFETLTGQPLHDYIAERKAKRG